MENMQSTAPCRHVEGYPVTLYPIGCENMTRIVEADGGYFIIGDDRRKLGLMDRKGRVVISPDWEAVRPYVDQNVVSCQKGHVTVLFNLQGETLTGLPLDTLLAESKQGVTVMTKGAQTMVCEELGDFYEGMARVKCAGYWGYVNNRGHYTGTLLEYNAAGNYHDGMAMMLKGKGFFKKGKLGYIDRERKEVIPAQFDDVKDFSQELAAVHTQDGWRYIRKDGSFLTCWEMVDGVKKEIKGFYRTENFENGYAMVFRMGRSATLPAGDGIMLSMQQDVSGWGLLSREGQLCVPCMFNRLSGVLEDGLCLYETVAGEGEIPKYGIIDPKKGVTYHGSVWPLIPLGDGYFTYEANGKHFIVDREGRHVNQNGLDQIGVRATGDTFGVKRDGKWGVIARDGRIVMPFVYDMEFNLCAGLGIVKQQEHYALVNERGEAVQGMVFTDAVNLRRGLALAEYEGKKYLVDFGYDKQFA